MSHRSTNPRRLPAGHVVPGATAVLCRRKWLRPEEIMSVVTWAIRVMLCCSVLPAAHRKNLHNVFVYGTLKKGQPNYHVMTDPNNGKAEFKGTGRTIDKYPLVIAKKGNIPFLLNVPGTGHHIAGEIYSVDDQMVQFLDEFESCPDMYQRTIKRIEILEWGGKDDSPEGRAAANTTECFVYSTTSYLPEWLNLPYLDCYDSYGTHGLRYISHRDR